MSLKKEDSATVIMALQILSLAKNIKLMEGTASVWEQLVAEDVKNDAFTISEFMEAIKVGVREKMYNRIDYADIYEVAVAKAKIRKMKEIEIDRKNKFQRSGDPMPKEIKEMLNTFKY